MFLDSLVGGMGGKGILTVTNIRTSGPALVIMVLYLVVVRDVEPPALGLVELRSATALFALLVRHLPLLHRAQGQVPAEEDVEGRIDVSHQVVAHENDTVEAVKDHADFHRAVPFIMAS